AQEAMGEVHPDAQASFDILTREGFETEHYIDIFDCRPTLHARTAPIRSIVQSQQVRVQLSHAPLPRAGRTWLVSNGLLQDFRALLLELDWEPGLPLRLDRATAEVLGVGEGASVRLVALRTESRRRPDWRRKHDRSSRTWLGPGGPHRADPQRRRRPDLAAGQRGTHGATGALGGAELSRRGRAGRRRLPVRAGNR